MTHKLCYECWVSRPLARFSVRTRSTDGLSPCCKDCAKIRKGRYPNRVDAKRKSETTRARRYGLTLGGYDQMCSRQFFGCAICRRDEKLVVDHDHKTGAIRSLLCVRCNILVGFLEHDLREAADQYIARHADLDVSAKAN